MEASKNGTDEHGFPNRIIIIQQWISPYSIGPISDQNQDWYVLITANEQVVKPLLAQGRRHRG